MGSTQKVTFRQVLGNRPFFTLWVARLVSGCGDWLALVALLSLISFRMHGSPSQLSGVLIAYITPRAFIAPLAGVFVDRWSLRRIMVTCDLLRAALVPLIVLASGLYQVYFILFVFSTVSCFFLPAQSASIPRLVSKEELLVANALNSQVTHLTKVISPALAGLLVAWVGEKLCFYIDSATFVLSALLLSTITLRPGPARQRKQVGSVIADLREGLRFIVKHGEIRFLVLSIAAAIFAVGVFQALITIYIRDVLSAASQFFGLFISLVGAGTILGALSIGWYAQRWPQTLMVIAGILTVGLSIFLLAVLPSVGATLLSSLGLGIGAAYALIPAQTLLQAETPQNLLGRVTSGADSFITAGQIVAFAAAGTIANYTGVKPLYCGVAFLLALTAFVGYVLTRPRLAGRPT